MSANTTPRAGTHGTEEEENTPTSSSLPHPDSFQTVSVNPSFAIHRLRSEGSGEERKGHGENGKAPSAFALSSWMFSSGRGDAMHTLSLRFRNDRLELLHRKYIEAGNSSKIPQFFLSAAVITMALTIGRFCCFP